MLKSLRVEIVKHVEAATTRVELKAALGINN
jgi:hypothetical protein